MATEDTNDNATAFSQALASVRAGKDITEANKLPAYLTAGDTLNIANENPTFIESVGDTLESIPKFIGASIISGANAIYNIPADIGNAFGGDFERSDTGEVIADLDDDLSQFYQEKKQGVDLVGFIISSLVPGTAGVKILNAGQKSLRAAIGSGKFGANTGKALGLLAPSKTVGLNKAIAEVATNSSAASLLNRNALRSIGAGLGQGALEALAFEVAITATLFKSPILENQDFGDFVSNVVWGASIFGLIGGTISAVKISSSLKRAADSASLEARAFQFIPEAATASKSYERVAMDFQELSNIPKIPTNVTPARATFLKNAKDTKIVTLEQRLRTEMGVLAGGDQEVAEVLFQSFKKASLNSQQSTFIGLVESSKFSTPTKLTAKVQKLEKREASGKASIKEIDELAESSISIAYVKTWGEDIGKVFTDTPKITSLVDSLKKGERIKVSATGVKAGKKTFAFDLRFNKGITSKIKGKVTKPWNIFTANPLEAQARYIWASKLPRFNPTAAKPLAVHVDDIPLMEKVFTELGNTDALQHVKFKGLKEGESLGDSLQEFLGARKVQLANRILKVKGEASGKVAKLTQDEIAAVINVKSSFLSGELIRDPVSSFHLDDILAMQSHAEKYTKTLVDQGVRKAKDGVVDVWAIPQHVKLTYDTSGFENLGNHVIENMATIKQQQKLYQEATGRASASVLAEDFAKFEDISSGKVFAGAVPSGSSAGLATSATSNYGTLAASVQNIGRTISRVIEKFKTRTRDTLEPLLFKLASNDQAAIEWSTLNARVRSIEGNYGINAAGDALEPLEIVRWKAATKAAQETGETLPTRPTLANPAMEARIELQTAEVRNLAKAHIEVNATRTNGLAGIRTSQGLQFNRAPDAFYPIPIDPRDFKHFALVTDESITSGNHVKTLFASSADELAEMIGKLKQNPHLKIRTKNEAEAYFKSRGQWDYEKTLSNNYLDVEAARKGVSAPFIVATDPQKITSDAMKWHMQRETGLVREAVAAKYEVQFEELKRLGEEFTNVATSQFNRANLVRYAEDSVKNPFGGYIKTALGISNTADYPWWVATNKMADLAVSSVLKKASAVMETAKSDADLLRVNKMLKQAGYKGATYDESMLIFANSTPAQGALTTVVQKANSIMATIVLRWDALNAVNNAVSANVLLGAETAAVIKAIGRGDAEAVGALAKLTKIKVPGTDKLIMSPTKLIANSIKKFNRNSDEMKWYRDNGYITSISDQYNGALDSLAFRGTESIKSWDSRINKLHDSLKNAATTGERWTGNRLAEEFNRFVAADVMKQMTDVAVVRKLMTGKEQLAYINTFVNRTQGNYTAAQRPMMFQGAIGQAIGLFQTYQFNLMQQLLRHVGEGHGKDAMTLLGLQGTIHGMNGLPGFNAVNTHVIGTASGNVEHRDAYSELYGIVGKEAGDWLMYGMASNTMGLLHPDLKVNLYTRGDINPRHLTILPTNPSSVPIIQATGKVLGNLFETAQKLAAGGDISTTLLQGLEHNGISRPLAGLAQTLEGLNNPLAASFSTSKRGNVIAANDLLSLTNLARIVGGKPLDEAIALDATYRFKAYALRDTRKRQVLGEAIKTTMIAGEDPSEEQIENFAEQYVATGGRTQEFNQWFASLNKTANTSQANKLQRSLTSPFTKSMQQIMGNRQLRDFSEEK